MRKILIIAIVVIFFAVLAFAAYTLLHVGSSGSSGTASNDQPSPLEQGTPSASGTNYGGNGFSSAGSAAPEPSSTGSSTNFYPEIPSGAPVGQSSNNYGSNGFGGGSAEGNGQTAATGTSGGAQGSGLSMTPTFNQGTGAPTAPAYNPSHAQSGSNQAPPQVTSFPAVLPSSSLPDYIGSASEIYGALPTGNTLDIGTSQGTVTVRNFYASDPPVDEAGDLVIKITADYLIVYNPARGNFWLPIEGTPFASWQAVAEQDLMQTLGIGQSDACRLSAASGVIYSPGNPDDGISYPLSFCPSGGSAQ